MKIDFWIDLLKQYTIGTMFHKQNINQIPVKLTTKFLQQI